MTADGMMGAQHQNNARMPWEDASVAGEPSQRQFSAYEYNGGTCVAVAGDDYCIVAADTRLSRGYSILSRQCPKVTQLTPQCVIATAGMQADTMTLHKVLK